MKLQDLNFQTTDFSPSFRRASFVVGRNTISILTQDGISFEVGIFDSLTRDWTTKQFVPKAFDDVVRDLTADQVNAIITLMSL